MIPFPTIAFAGMGIYCRALSRANDGADPEIEEGGGMQQSAAPIARSSLGVWGYAFPGSMTLLLRP